MSDTPRTDGFLNETSEQFHDTAWIEHSQQLERELNAANDSTKRMDEASNRLAESVERIRTFIDSRGWKADVGLLELNAANERIKRLEEAGDELRDLCVARWMGDTLDQATMVSAITHWNQAKEAKP